MQYVRYLKTCMDLLKFEKQLSFDTSSSKLIICGKMTQKLWKTSITPQWKQITLFPRFLFFKRKADKYSKIMIYEKNHNLKKKFSIISTNA